MRLLLPFLSLGSALALWTINQNKDFVFLGPLLNEENPIITNICSSFTAEDGKKYSTCSDEFTWIRNTPMGNYTDANSVTLLFDSTCVQLEQVIFLPNTQYMTIKLIIRSKEGCPEIKTNYILPIDNAEITNFGKSMTDKRLSVVPYDNDLYNMFESVSISNILNFEHSSSYVTALYNNDVKTVERTGLVMGFLEHEVWKSAINIKGGNLLNENVFFTAIAGWTSLLFTRDVNKHGYVSGKVVTSPLFFIGVYDDWRNGMEEYARSQVVAPLKWDVGAPIVGWNSWGELQFKVNATSAGENGQVISKLQSSGFAGNDGMQYIDLDAESGFYLDPNWQLRQNFVEEEKLIANQYAGFYMSPFSYLSSDLSLNKTCGGKSVPVIEMVKKSPSGKPIKVLDKEIFLTTNYAFDPTHPHVLLCALEELEKAIQLNFKLVKFDFINWGSLEGGSNPDGSNFDPLITTGTAAYTFGIKSMSDYIDNRLFISFSMAPLFPHGYAHSRRVACDQMYAGVEYTMNSLGGGWWMNELYILDPDLVVFSQEWIQPALDIITPLLAMDEESRVNKAIVHGGLYLAGDDLSVPSHVDATLKYLGNENVNHVIKTGKAFRPLFSIKDDFIAPHVFELNASESKDHNGIYIAVFNYSPFSQTYTYPLTSTSIPSGVSSYKNVWTSEWTTLKDSSLLTLTVEPKSSLLLYFPNHNDLVLSNNNNNSYKVASIEIM